MGSSIHCDHQSLGYSGAICAPSSKRPMDIVIFFFCLFKNIYTHSFRFLHQVVNVHGLQSGCLPRPSSNLLLLVSAWGIRKLN